MIGHDPLIVVFKVRRKGALRESCARRQSYPTSGFIYLRIDVERLTKQIMCIYIQYSIYLFVKLLYDSENIQNG